MNKLNKCIKCNKELEFQPFTSSSFAGYTAASCCRLAYAFDTVSHSCSHNITINNNLFTFIYFIDNILCIRDITSRTFLYQKKYTKIYSHDEVISILETDILPNMIFQ